MNKLLLVGLLTLMMHLTIVTSQSYNVSEINNSKLLFYDNFSDDEISETKWINCKYQKLTLFDKIKAFWAYIHCKICNLL